LKTIFSPSNIYHVPHPIEEKIKITLAQTTSKKTNGSPNENTQQSTKLEHQMKRKKNVMKGMLTHC
jgi:hypothetical protein